MTRKLNKPIAGYHLLMILSAVDHKFHAGEDLVIRDWLLEQFPFAVDLDKELHVISSLDEEAYMSNFQNAMNDFYQDSTEQERNELLAFAIKLAKSDKVISAEENTFLNELFTNWGNGTD